jgi:hypothetical protein
MELVERLSVPAARRVVVDTGKPVPKGGQLNDERKRAEFVDSQKKVAAERVSGTNQSHKQVDDVSRKTDKLRSDGKKTSEQQGKKVTRLDSDRTTSEIPPTPMAPRGPAPQVIVDTGRQAKSAEKSREEPRYVDNSRGKPTPSVVERKVDRATAASGEDHRKVVIKDKGQSRDVGHGQQRNGEGAELKKEARQKDAVEQRKDVKKQEEKTHQPGRRRADNVNNSAAVANKEDRQNAGERKGREQHAVKTTKTDEEVQTDNHRDKVSDR